MFKKDSDLEAYIYIEIGKELESKKFDMPLWIKAQEIAGGNEAKVNSVYIKLRKDKLYKNLINDERSLESIAPKLYEKKKEINDSTSGFDLLLVVVGWTIWILLLINFEDVLFSGPLRVMGGLSLFLYFFLLSHKTIRFISRIFI